MSDGRGSWCSAVAGPFLCREPSSSDTEGTRRRSPSWSATRSLVLSTPAPASWRTQRIGLELAPSIEVFLTHYHWDHIQGLSMFQALWSGRRRGPDSRSWWTGGALTSVITPPWFPVSLADAGNVRFQTIGRPVEIHGLVVTPFEVEHPQGAVGYRVDGPSASIGFVTDHEAGTERDASIVQAIRDVDVLIHDAQYTPG